MYFTYCQQSGVMKMIDWNALIKTDTETETQETIPKSRACPTIHDDDFEKVGQAKPMNIMVLKIPPDLPDLPDQKIRG